MASINEISYRTFDELLDSVRLDLISFNSAGDIDAANLIKKAQQINYELGLRIYMQKETMLEVEHHRAKLPADFHQSLLTLICHNYRHVQNAPWNGNVLLEEIIPPIPANPCPCFTVVTTAHNPEGVTTNIIDCYGNSRTVLFVPNNINQGTIPYTKICASSIDTVNTSGGTLTVTTNSNCGIDPSTGSYSCAFTTSCDICQVTHDSPCPEVVINPYPLGKTRSICNDQINIKILQFCMSEVRCYEQFERLWIVPHIEASAFSSQDQFSSGKCEASISKGFLYTPHMECTKVYMNYLGAMEDDDGNLLVLDHPVINAYYKWSLVEMILENLWLNGEEGLINRVKYAAGKKEEYRSQSMAIVNMPNYRDMINTIQVLRANHNRQYYHSLSRYYGRLGYTLPVDSYGIR